MTNSQENLSRSGVIDARAQYRAADRRLRNTALEGITLVWSHGVQILYT